MLSQLPTLLYLILPQLPPPLRYLPQELFIAGWPPFALEVPLQPPTLRSEIRGWSLQHVFSHYISVLLFHMLPPYLVSIPFDQNSNHYVANSLLSGSNLYTLPISLSTLQSELDQDSQSNSLATFAITIRWCSSIHRCLSWFRSHLAPTFTVSALLRASPVFDTCTSENESSLASGFETPLPLLGFQSLNPPSRGLWASLAHR